MKVKCPSLVVVVVVAIREKSVFNFTSGIALVKHGFRRLDSKCVYAWF